MNDCKLPLKIVLAVSVLLNVISIGFIVYTQKSVIRELSPLSSTQSPLKKELPLKKYAFPNLRDTVFVPQNMDFGPIQEEKDAYVARLFTYRVEGKTVSGIAHFPVGNGEYPVIIMIRGYVDKEIYTQGIGTNPAAEYFAQNGYITLAPDFLGYGSSDAAFEESITDRLFTYPTVLQLYANISQLNESLESSDSTAQAYEDQIGMWGHSNGGQIALSVLEVSDRVIPTVLWAPVSKPFPYSVLYYTDEFDDHGKYLRKVISQFEEDYDSEKYTLTNYLDLIQSPIQLHQGGADIAVPLEWSNELYEKLISLEADIEYDTYPQADHNMVPNWNTVAQSSLRFLDTHIK